jgi:hypothetical protein
MIVTIIAQPPEAHCTIDRRVCDDMASALQTITTVGNRFVVNDTAWFEERSGGGVTRTVVNHAEYLSKKVEDALETHGWDSQPTLSNQRIDGLLTTKCPGGVTTEEEVAFRIAQNQRDGSSEDILIDKWFSKYYQRYCRRNCFHADGLPSDARSEFREVVGRVPIRVGFEFETGNIASSFRALSKLSSLFQEGEIDAGVFVTSLDKETTAARIWPTSNRNGSFEELSQRHYRENLICPLWEIAFSPDGYSKTAPYLGRDGNTYTLVPSDERRRIGETEFEVFSRGKREYLKAVTPQPTLGDCL